MESLLLDKYNIPYFFTLLAYVFHEILTLRIILLLAHTGFFILAVIENHPSGYFWNPLFIAINLFHVIKILWLRRKIEFEGSVEMVYNKAFSNFSRAQFQEFWNYGKTHDSEGVIIEDGSMPDSLAIILKGPLFITKDNQILNTLGDARFCGEMSLLSQKPSSAQVEAKTLASLHSWSHESLLKLKNNHDPLWDLLLASLGREMAQKVSETNALKH